MSEKSLRCLIVCDSFGFPNGRASASRVKKIAYGMNQNGVNVSVLITTPTERKRNILNHQSDGSGEGYQFSYSYDNTILSDFMLLRKLQKTYGLMMSTVYMWRRREEINFVILYCRKIQTLFVMGLICRFLNIKTAVELCEWPESFNQKSVYQRITKRMFSRYVFSWVDKAIVISSFLSRKVQEYELRSRRKCPAIILPILIHNFEIKEKKKIPYSII